MTIKHRYPEDIARMVQVMNKQKNIVMTTEQVDRCWSAYSDRYAAGWLGLPTDDVRLVECMLQGIDHLANDDDIAFHIQPNGDVYEEGEPEVSLCNVAHLDGDEEQISHAIDIAFIQRYIAD